MGNFTAPYSDEYQETIELIAKNTIQGHDAKRVALLKQVDYARQQLKKMNQMNKYISQYRECLEHISQLQVTGMKIGLLRSIHGSEKDNEAMLKKIDVTKRAQYEKARLSIISFNQNLVLLAKNSFTALNNIRVLITDEEITYNIMIDTIQGSRSVTKTLSLNASEYLDLLGITNQKYRSYADIYTSITDVSQTMLILDKDKVQQAIESHGDDIQQIYDSEENFIEDDKLNKTSRLYGTSAVFQYLNRILFDQGILQRRYEVQEFFLFLMERTGYQKRFIAKTTILNALKDWKEQKTIQGISLTNKGELKISTRSEKIKTMFQGGDIGLVQAKRVAFVNGQFYSANAHMNTILNSLKYIDKMFPKDLGTMSSLGNREMKTLAKQLTVMFSAESKTATEKLKKSIYSILTAGLKK